MRQRFFYATCYDTLYRFTRKQWIAFCEAVASTGHASMTDHGAEIVGPSTDVTDWTPYDATCELNSKS